MFQFEEKTQKAPEGQKTMVSHQNLSKNFDECSTVLYNYPSNNHSNTFLH